MAAREFKIDKEQFDTLTQLLSDVVTQLKGILAVEEEGLRLIRQPLGYEDPPEYTIPEQHQPYRRHNGFPPEPKYGNQSRRNDEFGN